MMSTLGQCGLAACDLQVRFQLPLSTFFAAETSKLTELWLERKDLTIHRLRPIWWVLWRDTTTHMSNCRISLPLWRPTKRSSIPCYLSWGCRQWLAESCCSVLRPYFCTPILEYRLTPSPLLSLTTLNTELRGEQDSLHHILWQERLPAVVATRAHNVRLKRHQQLHSCTCVLLLAAHCTRLNTIHYGARVEERKGKPM